MAFDKVDYEGLVMLVCKRCRAGWDTFDPEAAKAHDVWHAEQEKAAKLITETETAQRHLQEGAEG